MLSTGILKSRGIAPYIITQPESMYTTPSLIGKFNVTAAGTGPLSYQWYKNGSVVTQATNSSHLPTATFTRQLNPTGKVRVFSLINNVWAQMGQSLFGQESGEVHGTAVAINSTGNRIAGSGTNTRVYEWNAITNRWGQMGAVMAGGTLSLNAVGDQIAIGNRYDISYRGSCKVYKWNSNTNTWEQKGQTISGTGVTKWDHVGASVSLNAAGDRLAVGSLFRNGVGPDGRLGEIKTYQWNLNTNTWVQIGQTINGMVSTDLFGDGVSLNATGNILLAGNRTRSNYDLTISKSRIFQLNLTTNTWVQIGQNIDNEGPGSGSDQSRAVTINANGDTICLGSAEANNIRIFERNLTTNQWSKKGQTITNTNNEWAKSGRDVSLNSTGNRVSVGAAYDHSGGGGAGSVNVYEWDSRTREWKQLGQGIFGEQYANSTANSLNSSGDIIVTGHPMMPRGKYDIDYYHCVVTNSYGSATSTSAVLVIQ